MRRPSAVDRGGRSTLEHLDALDIVRIDVGNAVRRYRAEAWLIDGGQCVVVHRRTVDDEQRLPASFDRLEAPNQNGGASPWVARLRRHFDVGRLRRQRVHEIWLVGVGDVLAIHGAHRAAKLLAHGRRAFTGHDDFGELNAGSN